MISSNIIKEPNPKLIISSAYRAAFSEVFKVLSKEYAQNNISCINIAPGPINTDRTQDLIGNVKEFAQLAEHIVNNSYINGETIRLDSAMRMGPK